MCISKPWNDSSCNAVVFDGRATFGSYAMPRGMKHFARAPGDAGRINRELGRDHAQLPVTHTHTMQHAWQPGLWFYYMRGCSDFEWDMGRTLLVRNRCHMTGVLEQRAHGIGWAAAVRRVARKLVLAANVTAWAPDFGDDRTRSGSGSMIVGPLESIVGGSVQWPPPPEREPRHGVDYIAGALDLCARGLLTDDPELRELTSLLYVLNTLDYLAASVLYHDLHGTPNELDTIQIANQCLHGSNSSHLADPVCHQASEIWDVRSIGPMKPWSQQARPWRAPNGSLCELSESMPLCMSCRHTESERACQYKCSASKPHRMLPQTANSVNMTYGQVIRKDLLQHIIDHGALGKAETWRFVWDNRVVQRLPRLPPPHLDREHEIAR